MAQDLRVTVLDRVIGWISPGAGLRRMFDRMRLERAYEAASPRDPWKPRRAGASANADHLADAARVRVKARALVQNVPYINAGLGAHVANVVGTGIVPRATGRQADAMNALWQEWVKVADADGYLDYYGLQAKAVRAAYQDGEVLVRLRPRYSTDGLPIPLQLQVLEIDWLDTGRVSGANAGNEIVNGIEFDGVGRVVAYWLWDTHPGDVTLRKGSRTQSRRIPADQIIHLFNPERPGQSRGMSRLAPVITRARDLQLYEDAEIARKNLEARTSVLASGDPSAMANPSVYGGDQGDPAENARKTGDLGQLASGGITMLPPGVNLTVVEPKPAGGHVEYVKLQLHIIAVGAGWTYEMMTGDMKEVNFSSARVRQNDYRRGVEQEQWLWFIPMFCDRVWREVWRHAELGGKLAKPDYRVEHATPKWEYVNPKEDVASDIEAVFGGGLMSWSESVRRRGYDPVKVRAELKADFDALKEDGVLDILMLFRKGRQVDEPQQPAQPPAKPK